MGEKTPTSEEAARALALPPDILTTARQLKGIYPPDFITQTLAELCAEQNVRGLSEDDVRACFSRASPELLPALPPLPDDAVHTLSDAFRRGHDTQVRGHYAHLFASSARAVSTA